MNSISFASRLLRDLKERDLASITADTRLTVLDAINGSLQKIHSLSPHIHKETTGSIFLAAPSTISIGVTNGSVEVTGYAFTDEQRYCTIRVDGDPVDNQIMAGAELLHPYMGSTGTVNATIYYDAVQMPEPYEELIGDPRSITNNKIVTKLTDLGLLKYGTKALGTPERYWVEANALIQVPDSPAVIRFDMLPSQAMRYQARFTLAPSRIKLTDLTAPGVKLPIREEHVELYLLPIARGILADSEMWRDPETRASAKNEAGAAEAKYESLTISTLATPQNRSGTKFGF